MTTKEINGFRTSAAKAIEAGRLAEAIDTVRALPSSVRDYTITSDLDRAAEHYRYMLRYFADGASDPGRRDSYDELRADLRRIVDRCTRRMMAESTSSLYYNTLRTLGVHPERTIADAATERQKIREQLAATFDINNAAAELRRRNNACEIELFERIWTVFPMTGDDRLTVRSLLESDSAADHNLRMRLIAAAGLGLMEFYDTARFELLADVLDTSADEREALAATCWILLALFRYRKRRHPHSVRARIKAASEHPLWQRRVRSVYLELLRSRDTERVTRQVRDEMMPDIMRLGKDIFNRNIPAVDENDSGEIEINPEWEEKMRQTGLYDRMREFSEMTSEGADIFMGAFSHLKNYPFFNRIQGWFTPFDEGDSDVSAALEGEMASLVDMLTRMPMPCDNDKFSILFSLQATPADKREIVARQIDSNRHAMEQNGMLDNADAGNTAAVRAYVQNIYRFYKLYNRRTEFFDPFARGIFLQDIDLLDSAVRNADTLYAAAELLFKIHAWDDARQCYQLLGDIEEPSAEIYQKTAYCLEQTGRYAEAAEHYGYSDLMDGTNAWTLTRLAHTLSQSGQPERALNVLERLVAMKPDDNDVRHRMAYTLIQCGKYDRASALLRELAGSDVSAADRTLLRALAWSTFVAGDADASRGYYHEILARGAAAEDYLNMGHLAWAESRMADAIRLYRRYTVEAGCDLAALERAIRDDMPALAAYRLNLSDLPLILDAIRTGIGEES